jgi:hypothetical protein
MISDQSLCRFSQEKLVEQMRSVFDRNHHRKITKSMYMYELLLSLMGE